jgi:hypothetical protein
MLDPFARVADPLKAAGNSRTFRRALCPLEGYRLKLPFDLHLGLTRPNKVVRYCGL